MQRFLILLVSELLYKMIIVGGLNLTPNFKTLLSCDIMIEKSDLFYLPINLRCQFHDIKLMY